MQSKPRLRRATTHFYELMLVHADHTVAWEIVQRLNGRISRLRALTIADKSRARPEIEHMKAIHDAIVAKNPEAARKAVHEHMDAACATAQKSLNMPQAEGEKND